MSGAPTTAERVLGFLARHPDKAYTPKQVARWLEITERTALKHLNALVQDNKAHVIED